MTSTNRVFLTPLTKTSEEYANVLLRLSGAILREGHRDELNHLVGETLIRGVCDTRSEDESLKVEARAFKIANPMLEHAFIREGSYSAAIGTGAISQLGHLPLPEAVGDAFVDTSSLYGWVLGGDSERLHAAAAARLLTRVPHPPSGTTPSTRSSRTDFISRTARPCAFTQERCACATATRPRARSFTRAGRRSCSAGSARTTRSLRLRGSLSLSSLCH